MASGPTYEVHETSQSSQTLIFSKRKEPLRGRLMQVDIYYPGVARANNWVVHVATKDREVVEPATGRVLFRIVGQHFARRAGTEIRFPDSRRIAFPVRCDGVENAVMSGIDASGESLLHLRRTDRHENDVQVSISPGITLSPETLCLITIAASLFNQYFEYPKVYWGEGG